MTRHTLATAAITASLMGLLAFLFEDDFELLKWALTGSLLLWVVPAGVQRGWWPDVRPWVWRRRAGA